MVSVLVARRLYELGQTKGTGLLRVSLVARDSGGDSGGDSATIELFHGWVHAIECPRVTALRGEDRLRQLLERAEGAAPEFHANAPPRKRGACTPFHPAAAVRNFIDARRLEPTSWRARVGAGTIMLAEPPHASCVGADERPLVAYLSRQRTTREIDEARLCPPARADRLITFLYAVSALTFHAPPASPWSLLELEAGAPVEEIKRAYRRLARELHPDRHPTASAEDLRELERRFAEVSAAYRRLV